MKILKLFSQVICGIIVIYQNVWLHRCFFKLSVWVSDSWFVWQELFYVKEKFWSLMKPHPRLTWKLTNSFNRQFGGSSLTVPCLQLLTGSTPSWTIPGKCSCCSYVICERMSLCEKYFSYYKTSWAYLLFWSWKRERVVSLFAFVSVTAPLKFKSSS